MDQLLQIDVPAEPPSLRLVRLGTLLDAAERAGMDCDGADDLRIGVEELCMAVLGGCAADRPARLAMRFPGA